MAGRRSIEGARLRRWRVPLAAALVLAGVVGAGPAPPAGGSPSGRAQAGAEAQGAAGTSPTISVTPQDGAGIGEVLTVTGHGFGTLDIARPFVALCASEPVAAGTPFDGRSLELIEPHCAEPLVPDDVADDGSFTLEVPVTTARANIVWAGGLDVGPDLLWETAAAPVALAPPGGQEVRARLATPIAYAGQAPRLRATFDVTPASLALLTCSEGVLAGPTSLALVYANCDPEAAIDVGIDAVGEVVADVRLPAGTGAVWVGGPAGVVEPPLAALIGGAAPVTVYDPTMTVTPSTGLVDGQEVAVALDDLGPPGRGTWTVAQCDSSVLDDLGGDLEWRCSPPLPAGDVSPEGSLAFEAAVAAEPSLGPVPGFPTVDCTASAGACVLLASAWFSDGQPPARYAVPLDFTPAAPSVVAPGSVEVTEGDSGTVTAEVPVTLSGPSAAPVTVRWATFAAPDVPWAATPGEDHVTASGTLTVAPGETTASIPVEVLGDSVAEADEMALVALTDPTGATIGGYGGIGGVRISDDD